MTQRSYSELIAQFPDNITGLITPADLRDFVDSVRNPFGRLSMGTPAATTIVTPGTYELMAGTTVASGTNYLMTPSTAGRLTYTGVSDRHFHVAVSISMTCGANNQLAAFRLAKNGTTEANSQVQRQVSTGADVGSTALHADVMLSTNDYIELYLTNQTSTATVTVTDLYFFAAGMLM